MTEKAYAKINLTLDVLGKRPDGYHDLQTIMQTVSLCDTVTVQVGTGAPWRLSCDAPGVPCDARNLMWKAAKAFYEATRLQDGGLAMTLEKHIPSEAGMGGGSADAAAVLRLLNRHYGTPFSTEQLAAVGAAVGSDVPFCVVGGACMCEGRGEILRPVAPLAPCCLVICKPDFSVSTPALYGDIDSFSIEKHPDQNAMEQSLQAGDLAGTAEALCNVFEPLVASRYPQIQDLRSRALQAGALGFLMTGSGSAVYAIFGDEAPAVALQKIYRRTYDRVYLATPV